MRWARELVAALEQNNEAAELEAVNAILQLHDKQLHNDLSRIANELRNVLSAPQFSGELSRLAKSELPDAQQRLNRVIELTQSAADTSLTAVETALPLIKGVRATIASLENPDSPAYTFNGTWTGKSLIALLNQIATDAAAIEKCLSDILMAQGFQDITGQIIRRVVKLVAELENYLSLSGVDLEDDGKNDDAALRQGNGPAIEGIDANALQHQDDVDDLLGQLGL